MKIGAKDKYWICKECGEKKKWKAPTGAVTMIKGHCGYCMSDEEKYLIPIVDFDRPGKPAIWD